MQFIKFASGPEGEDPHIWGDIFVQLPMNDGNERLHIGVSRGQVALIKLLAAELEPPYHILYVLIMNREGQREGRYQLTPLLDAEQLSAFFDRYGTVFEQDGRHAVWVQSESGQLIFTPHDIIYAYGPLEAFRTVLLRRDFVEKPVEIPAPHAHYYHAQFDPVVRDILAHYEWQHFPLLDIDDET